MFKLLLLLLCAITSAHQWTETNLVVDDEKLVSFNIFLKLRNTDFIFSELRQISDPKSSRYTNYKTKEEINEILRPNHNVDELMDYLGKSKYCTDNVLAISCKMPIWFAEYLFDSQFTTYQNENTGKLRDVADSYTVPHRFKDDVFYILGLVDFPENNEIKPKINWNFNDDQNVISRESLFSLYNITDEPQNESSTSAVCEYQNDACFNMDDYRLFQTQNGMDNTTNVTIYGDCDTSTTDPDVEASLDLQFNCAVGNCAQQQYISSPGWLMDVLQQMYAMEKPPLVTSHSYGWFEGNQDMVIPGVDSETYVKQCNLMYATLSLMGSTFVVSSGDSGSATRTNEDCSLVPHFRAEYPASSPYVLSIGGTTFLNEVTGGTSPFCKTNKCVMHADEINTMADNVGWCSGSSIATFSDREWWAIEQNKKYLADPTADFLPEPDQYPPLGRIVPDTTMMAHNYMVAMGGSFMPVDGTSASAPAFAGMVARLNSVRLNHGCKSVGLFGPLLYQMYDECPTCFLDRVVGCSNSTESGDCNPPVKGLCATKGYDAIYGLGLPNYGAMSDYVKKQCLNSKVQRNL